MQSPSFKPPVTLKIVLDILLVLMVVVTIVHIIFSVFILSNTEETLPFAVHPNFYDKLHTEVYFILLPSLLSRILFIYAILRFKHLVALFFKGVIFSLEQIKITGVIGKLILIAAILKSLPAFIYKHFIEEAPRTVNYNFAGVDSFWFIISIGLFFIFLSKIFDNARILKEENELTV